MNYRNASAAKTAKRSLSTKEIVLSGMFAAVLTVISQVSIPMPTGVPITIQVFGVALVGVTLGWRLGLLTTLVYILLGAVGLPVFANFRGGISSLLGFTGGYIWTWPFMALLCGIRPQTKSKHLNTALIFLFSIIGLAVNEIAGCVQWAALSGEMSLWGVLTYSLVAFIPKDVVLTLLAVAISLPLRRLVAKGIGSI